MAINHTLKNGETVYFDADDARGPWTFLLPPNPANGSWVEFKEVGIFSKTEITLDGNGKNIEFFDLNLNAANVSYYPDSDLVRLQFNEGRDTWCNQWAFTIADQWQMTPIVDMSGNQTIQWTFVPFAPGETPKLMTHASGVFTFTSDAILYMNWFVEIDMVLSANNSDVDFSITPTYTGGGISIAPRIVDSFAHSRSGVFPRSKNSEIAIAPNVSETLSFITDASGTAASTCDLSAGFMLVTND